MPRVSRQQTERNREIILEVATRLFRERGLKGLSVADVMSAAGLTHGGFYGHFDSKEALAAQACRQAFAQSVQRWAERTAPTRDRKGARQALIDNYLADNNRDLPGEGCPTVGFAGDVCREPADSPLRKAYREGVHALLDDYEAVMDPPQAEQRRQAALVEYTLMVGAITLARATEGDPLSDEILHAVREHLT
ncbi:TetR family transcriptional regulator [Pseudomonas sp. M47T1]|uniref:TetR/AcrR family transcriptional regulator n=1 Tax=unclassified Pseudomonas TaxID=196821 RepID=UPI0002608851|nr:TetR/AcrR family transcriptional regulator [Pseudomonas sp. M47T1]EIK95814.1 TetR family transcriptional regulator [Pseudomonas sp. M47T1]